MTKHTNNNIPTPEPANNSSRESVNISLPEEPVVKPRRFKALNIIGFSLLGIVALIAILLCAATYYLSPERLEKLIAEAASENLNAEVTVSQPRFTIWSSLPNLRVEIDSVKVISHSLQGIPENLRNEIPDNADFLMSSGKIKGNINIFKLIKGEIHLGDLEADELNLNMVMVSDSVANFNILKDKTSSGKVPYFSARKIALVNPGNLSFYNHASRVSANLDLNTLTALRDSSDNNSYKADIQGALDLNMGGKQLLGNFPIHLHGDAGLGFNPMTVKLSDFNIDLGKLRGVTNLAMTVEGEQKIDSFDYKLQETPLSAILSLLPEGMVKWPAALKADPEIGLDAHLTAPFSLSSDALPSAEGSLSIPSGELSYKEQGLPLLNVGYSPIEAKMAFDGKNPEAASVQILPFSVNGEGAEITVSPNISDLASDPHLKLELNGKYDAAAASKFFSALGKYALKGKIEGIARIDLKQSDITADKLQDIIVDADLKLKNYSSRIPQMGMAVNGNSLDISAKGDIKNVAVDLTADNFTLNQGKGQNIVIKDLAIKGKASESSKGKGQKFDIDLKGGSFVATSGVEKLTLNDITTDISAYYSDSKLSVKPFTMPKEWTADNQALSFAKHGSQFLVMNLPQKFTNVINHWQPAINVKVKSGSILTPVLPLHNDFHDLDLSASFDSINLKSLKMNSQDTRLKLNGKVTGLKRFLTSKTPVPLNFALDLAVDTVFINQLAGAYNHGIKYRHGQSASFLTVIPDTLTQFDTIAMLLPRNLAGDIKASIMETSYTNIQLHNLGTTVTLNDGDLKVKDLEIESFFGALGLDFAYNTSDITKLGMALTANLNKVELVNFFSRFHTLMLMMPVMEYVHGTLSLSTDARLLLFPNMYINLPSVWADIYLRGNGLTILENKEMHKITRLLGINTSNGGIFLNDLNIHATAHDNLFQLYPFDIRLQRYKLKAGGTQNFNGDMYYHLAVDKSPIPFPFGISITGNMKHPKLHFGGTSFSSKDAESVAASIMEAPKVNLLLGLQRLVREMLAKAAEADTTPTSSYVY